LKNLAHCEDAEIAGVAAAHPDLDFDSLDLHNPKTLRQLQLKSGNPKLVDKLRTHQRLIRLCGNVASADALSQNGIHSAAQVSQKAKGCWVDEMASTLGTAEAENVHKRAQAITAQTMHAFANIHSVVASPRFRGVRANNIAPDVTDRFTNLTSYQEIFGSLDYCACEECKSIMGPAAYFTDLMRIIDTYVTGPNKKTIKPDLTLEKRRPLLFSMLLDCANTNDLVPYLQIVNDTLVERLKTDFGKSDVYKALANGVYPYPQPYNKPVTAISALLSQAGLDLEKFYAAMSMPLTSASGGHFKISSADQSRIARAQIGLTPEQINLTTVAAASAAALSKRYGVDVSLPDFGGLTHINTFLAQTGLTRDALHALVYQNLSKTELGQATPNKGSLAASFFINASMTGGKTVTIAPDSRNPELSVLTNLNLATLDRIFRFTRLAAMIGWDYGALDWALTCLGGSDITAGTLADLGHIKQLADRLELPVVQVCSLIYDIKTIGVGDGTPSQALFDQAFNAPQLLGERVDPSGSKPPTYTIKPYHPETTSGGTPNSLFQNPYFTDPVATWTVSAVTDPDGLAARIASGLGLAQSDIAALAAHLFTGQASVDLSVSALSAFYRNGLLARAIGLNITSYLTLLDLLAIQQTPAQPLKIEDVIRIVETGQWLSAQSYAPADLDFILTGAVTEQAGQRFSTSDIEDFLSALWSGKSDGDAEARVIAAYTNFFGIDETLAKAVCETASTITQNAKIWQTITTKFPFTDTAKLETIKKFTSRIARLIALVDLLSLLPEELTTANAHPQFFNLTNLRTLDIAGVAALASQVSLRNTFNDDKGLLLGYYASAPGSPKSQATGLAKLAGWSIEQSAALIKLFWPKAGNPGSKTLAAVNRLLAGFELLSATGGTVGTLKSLNAVSGLKASSDTDWKQLNTLVDDLSTTLQGTMGPSGWDTAAEASDAMIAERDRDALAATALVTLGKKYKDITTYRALYEFLLIDVEMSGCQTVSVLKQGLNSLQLYLQRARLGLEIGIEKLEIPPIWWEWMMNYRVWQANRMIFLYPENYIDPSLRASASPLFNQLESSILQGEITEASVEAVYRSYLDGLEELTNLNYVDAYRCVVEYPDSGPIDTLFLFARTRTEPYDFYYCSYRADTLWSAWQKIDLTINAQQITPVYAFSRLFLFWVELKKTKDSSIQSKDSAANSKSSTIYNATTKYSFNTFQGKWVAPQVLSSTKVVNYLSVEYPNSGVVAPNGSTFYEMDNLHWLKCYVVYAESDSYSVGTTSDGDLGRLCIFYGPSLENTQTSVAMTLPKPPTPSEKISDDAFYQFAQNTFQTVEKFNQVQRVQALGYVPITPALTLNLNLEKSHIISENEFGLMASSAKQHSPAWYKPEIDRMVGALSLVESNSALQDIYCGDPSGGVSDASFAQPATPTSFVGPRIDSTVSQQIFTDLVGLNIITHVSGGKGTVDPYFNAQSDLSTLFGGQIDVQTDQLRQDVRMALFDLLGSPALLGAISQQNSASISVKNLPGSFIFANGDETFLMRPAQQSFAYINSALNIRYVPSSPMLNDEAFIGPGINSSDSVKIFNDLVGNNIVKTIPTPPDSGILSSSFNIHTNLGFLFGDQGNTPQYAHLTRQVRSILLSLPSISRMQYLGNELPHIVQVGSFITNYTSTPDPDRINAKGSKSIYDDLLGNNIINDSGVVEADFDETTNLDFLFGGNPALQKKFTPFVRSVLLALPMFVQTGSFVSSIITPAQSSNAYTALQGHKILDTAGVVDVDYSSKTDLSFLFASVTPKGVRAAMIKRVETVLQQYHASTWDIVPRETSFSVERISAEAVHQLSQRLFAGGLDRLLSLSSQQAPIIPELPFSRLQPTDRISAPPALMDGKQVDFEGPYSLYFWELFFHGPMLVSQHLATNQKFQSAQKWLQYIYDPTATIHYVTAASFLTPDIDVTQAQDAYAALVKNKVLKVTDGHALVAEHIDLTTDLDFLFLSVHDAELRALMIEEVRNVLWNDYLATPPSHYWQFQPFRSHTLKTLKENLTNSAAIMAYNDDPFDPHAIARLRIGAYEKSVVMKYIDNLLNWGDALFTQYTWESITAARMLYVYAYDLLGPAPEDLGPCNQSDPVDFATIRSHYQAGKIPQFYLDLENHVKLGDTPPAVNPAGHPFNNLPIYFCVPENVNMNAYWTRVQDRLYKIRHCENIDGEKVPLALFQPPIDPMDLVRAAANGGNVMGTAGGQGKLSSHYRFSVMVDKARSFTSLVSEMGHALLSALEKGDAEQLAQIRASHEQTVLNMSTVIKQKRLADAQQSLAALQQNLAAANFRQTHFETLIADGLNSHESDAQALSEAAIAFQVAAAAFQGVAIAGYLAPSIFGLADGGMKWGDAVKMGADISNSVATTLNQGSSLATMMGQFDRRSEDWDYQKALATYDINALTQQIAAANSRLEALQDELNLHQTQISQSNEILSFLKDKFTNQQLYQWMATRLSSIYYQAYQLAIDMARSAQDCYQYELLSDDSFINFEYFDSAHKGLLAGEALSLSLSQMEQSYLSNNSRRLEIEKTIALSQLNPMALWQLKTTGSCDFVLDEMLFDYDFPGHYGRQIKSVSISIPAVIGPYQNVHATLQQNSNAVVLNGDAQGLTATQFLIDNPKFPEKKTPAPPPGVRMDWLPNQQVAISTGVRDSGLFQLDFNDSRYLPFEGTGAVSSWTLSMPHDTNPIDFDNLSDIILHLKYSAHDGGSSFQTDVIKALKKAPNPYRQFLYLDLSQYFGDAWQKFMSTKTDDTHQVFTLPIGADLFPQYKGLTFDAVTIRLDLAADVNVGATPKSFMTFAIAANTGKLVPYVKPDWTLDINASMQKDPFTGEWSISVDLSKVPDPAQLLRNIPGTHGSGLKDKILNPDALLGMEMIVTYTADIFN
jgi:hypothetical protein